MEVLRVGAAQKKAPAPEEKKMEKTPKEMSPAELAAYAASLLKPSSDPWWIGRRVDPSTGVLLTLVETEGRRKGFVGYDD